MSAIFQPRSHVPYDWPDSKWRTIDLQHQQSANSLNLQTVECWSVLQVHRTADSSGNSSTVCFNEANVFPTLFTFSLCSWKSSSAAGTFESKALPMWHAVCHQRAFCQSHHPAKLTDTKLSLQRGDWDQHQRNDRLNCHTTTGKNVCMKCQNLTAVSLLAH